MQIILLYGGQSAEHDISILSAHNIAQMISYDTYSVRPVMITREGEWIAGEILTQSPSYEGQLQLIASDHAEWGQQEGAPSYGIRINPGDIYSDNAVVFPVLHGPNGEDGTIQGFLETLHMPYVGAGVAASACGMDKIITKQLFDHAGLPQVPYISFDRREWTLHREELIVKAEGNLLYPLFVKPANMGSSVGIARVEQAEELVEAVEEALTFDHRIVVEQGIQAEEVEVAILGNEDGHASVVGRLVKEASFYNYEEKYLNNTVQMEIPANIEDNLSNTIREYAIRAYRSIDGSGLARVDFFLTNSGDIYINEINTMPGFTQYSMYPVLWEHTGLNQRDLVEELIQLALNRFQERRALRVSR